MLVYHLRGKRKILKVFICFIIFLCCKEPYCFAQYQKDSLKLSSVYQNKVFLTKNEQQLLPIVNITDNFGLFLPTSLHNDFLNFSYELEQYSSFDKYPISNWEENEFNFWLKSKDLIILTIDQKLIENKDFLNWYHFQSKNSPEVFSKIIAVFLEINHEFKFPTSVNVQQVSMFTASIVAQSIFGALPFYDEKGVAQTKGDLRLGNALPETVHMDGNLLNEKIDSIANVSIEKGAFPGVQILIAKNSKVIFHKAYGYHTYEKTRKVKLNDLYDFASVSKVTTALPALMKLHGEGKFDLDKPFKTYFPKFKKSNKANLSYREILAHQSGLRPWIPYWRNTIKENGKFKRRTFKKKYSRRYNVSITDQLFLHKKYKKKIYKAICNSDVNEEKKYKYSGLAFYLFPEMVSELTQTNYETYLKSTFYKPLGATTLTYNPLRFFPKERIIPTERDTFFRQEQIHGTVHDEGAIMMGGVSANAGLFGTANDLAKLMQMYLNGGTYGGKRFIAEESIQEFTKYQYPENENRRGLGFDKPLLEYDPAKSSVAKDASPSSYGHSGYTGTFVWVDPEYDLIYIFFSNRVFPTRDNRKIYELNIRPSIHQVIYDAMND